MKAFLPSNPMLTCWLVRLGKKARKPAGEKVRKLATSGPLAHSPAGFLSRPLRGEGEPLVASVPEFARCAGFHSAGTRSRRDEFHESSSVSTQSVSEVRIALVSGCARRRSSDSWNSSLRILQPDKKVRKPESEKVSKSATASGPLAHSPAGFLICPLTHSLTDSLTYFTHSPI
jgi:hypothetical protein